MDNLVGKIIDYENGDMSETETLEFFQELVDSGLVWKLQGSYGRMAQDLINQHLIHPAQ